jgi:hypothetical protein
MDTWWLGRIFRTCLYYITALHHKACLHTMQPHALVMQGLAAGLASALLPCDTRGPRCRLSAVLAGGNAEGQQPTSESG